MRGLDIIGLVSCFLVCDSLTMVMLAKKSPRVKTLGSGKWGNDDYWKYSAKTDNQRAYIAELTNPETSVVLGLGPAGCGKTLLACNAAISDLKMGVCDRIVITRPIIPVDDEELGFLPGSIMQKMDPWTRPIFDIFEEFYSKTQIAGMIKSGVIEISPLAFMRGRTFKKAFILADEMQNSSPNQMLMMLTRIGEGSKIVVTGDLKQSDRSDKNGLQDFLELLSISNVKTSIKLVEMDGNDVLRSAVVRDVLSIYSCKAITDLKSVTISHDEKVSDFNVTSEVEKSYKNSDKYILNTTSIDDDDYSDSALIPMHHFLRNIK